MKNNRKILIIIIIILIVIIVAYSVFYVMFINKIGVKNKLVNTKWSLEKINLQKENDNITEENKDFNINIEFNKSKAIICLSFNDCHEANYRLTYNGYRIDKEKSVFLNGDLTITGNNQLLITRKINDNEIAKYYFERIT